VVTVRFVVHPEFRDQFHALVLRNAAQSRELEAGCIRFDVLTPHDPDAAGDVFLYELYDSEAAFEDHLNMRHFIDFDLVTRPMVLS
jgi:quinol monooxygenase YgiN